MLYMLLSTHFLFLFFFSHKQDYFILFYFEPLSIYWEINMNT